ncbi:helix-turn-helix transcriptional regulator [Planomicrobium okeanokoites]|uniref:helix-turn-helix transcriptional regulator n=1 Tax=Planomicrobium okeanokoites TaxID=244 RepID=UPI0009FCCD5B|nr:WYL domain-containing protein [Planomicrobium okeanokoites]
MVRKRLLAVINCLSTYSSKEQPLSLQEIKSQLMHEYDLELSDKMIRTELKFLQSSASLYKLETGTNNKNYKEKVYYLENTSFQIHELRYLMDAVSSARFISQSETNQLIYKLRGLTDEFTSKRLANELIHTEGKIGIMHFADNVQTLHEAIKAKKCVKFQYGRYNVDKEFILSREGDFYKVIPLGVVWYQEYYYLIAKEEGKEKIIQYRIDRMSSVMKTEDSWVPNPGFDLEKYVSQLFHMYSGEQSGIAMEFDNHLINVVIDRFGLDAKIKNLENGRFLLEVDGVVSMGLVRWLLTWGADAKALRPTKLVDMMKKEIGRYDGLYT